MGIPPTGKSVRVTSVSHLRFRDGKVSEEWENIDMLGLLTQIGAIPSPEVALA
jgi:predicted ester cyclase